MLDNYKRVKIPRLGGMVTNVPPHDVPLGLSPLVEDCEFTSQTVKTRAGLTQILQLPDNQRTNGLDVFIRQAAATQSNQRLIVFGSAGKVYKETVTLGALKEIGDIGVPELYMLMTTAYDRAYMAFSNLISASAVRPRQYLLYNNLNYFDGLGADPAAIADVLAIAAATSTSLSPGDVPVGTFYCTVLYVTRSGYITGILDNAVLPVVITTADRTLHVSNIPVGPEGTVKRILVFTEPGVSSLGPYYYIPFSYTVQGGLNSMITSTVIDDNSTTEVNLNFSADALRAGLDVTDYFDKLIIPPVVGLKFLPSLKRIAYWGNQDEPSTVFMSEPDDPETLFGTKSRILVAENDGQRIQNVFEHRGEVYVAKERSGHIIQPNNSYPATWDVVERWNGVGPCSPRALALCEEFVTFAHRSGLYRYLGGAPEWVSWEHGGADGLWAKHFDWLTAHLIAVAIDIETKKVFITQAHGEAVTPTIHDDEGEGVSVNVLLITSPCPTTELTYNEAFTYALTSSGGLAPIHWELIAGALPTGVSLNESTGELSGTPTVLGTFTWTIQATDSSDPALTATITCSLTVVALPLEITSVCPTEQPEIGVAYSTTFTATGGVPPYVWSATGLPDGLTINASTGEVSGTATETGTFPYTVTVMSADDQEAHIDCEFVIVSSFTAAEIAYAEKAQDNFDRDRFRFVVVTPDHRVFWSKHNLATPGAWTAWAEVIVPAGDWDEVHIDQFYPQFVIYGPDSKLLYCSLSTGEAFAQADIPVPFAACGHKQGQHVYDLCQMALSRTDRNSLYLKRENSPGECGDPDDSALWADIVSLPAGQWKRCGFNRDAISYITLFVRDGNTVARVKDSGTLIEEFSCPAGDWRDVAMSTRLIVAVGVGANNSMVSQPDDGWGGVTWTAQATPVGWDPVDPRIIMVDSNFWLDVNTESLAIVIDGKPGSTQIMVGNIVHSGPGSIRSVTWQLLTVPSPGPTNRWTALASSVTLNWGNALQPYGIVIVGSEEDGTVHLLTATAQQLTNSSFVLKTLAEAPF